MSALNHLWQRFLLSASLLFGLAIGVAATVFGYSNLLTVDVHWSVLHVDRVPLWTVAVVPLVVVLVAGTLYHWADGLHHFTEHMRHRRRVHELEAEVASLRAHLDQVLEMPDQSSLPGKRRAAPSLPPADEGIEEPVRPESTSTAKRDETSATREPTPEPTPEPAPEPAPKPEKVEEAETDATPEASATPAPANSEAPKTSNRRPDGAKGPAKTAATHKAGEPRRRATLLAAGETSGSQATAEHESSAEADREATPGPEA